jgi:hypothetical protein
MAQDVTGGKGRKDEVGRSGIYPATGPYPDGETPVITPAEINSNSQMDGPGVETNDDLDDRDMSDSDALGG